MSDTAPTALTDTLLARTHTEGDCLVWQLVGKDRQVRFWTGGKTDGRAVPVRKVIYEAQLGPLPTDFVALKPTCGHPQCVKPEHMRIVTAGKKREAERAAMRAARPAVAKPAKPAKPAVVRQEVVRHTAPAPIASFVFNGSELGVNAFTAVPPKSMHISTPAEQAYANARACRPAHEILADAKNQLAIGKPADSDRRAGMRRASI